MKAEFNSSVRLFFDLSARVKLRVNGADRLRFLNGQLTNDVRKATDTKTVEACVLNAKGKMDAHLFLHAKGDSFLLDAEAALAPTLQPRLERYVIADDVVIQDLRAQWSIFHLIGQPLPKISATARVVLANRFGEDGHDLWIEAAQSNELAAIVSRTFGVCDEKCAEGFRIRQGIPRWGCELTSEIIPIEANLEGRCIDYEKGCYIGQETISRMKMSGQRNKQLCGVVSLDNLPLRPGARLVAEGKDVGWLTSATRSRDREIALGYIKRRFNAVGSRLDAIAPESDGIRVEVVDLPF
jgi:folate-binding protein YgfZ